MAQDSIQDAGTPDAITHGTYAVRINALSRSFGRITALDGITADIRKGGITGLVGPDAAGKTTLMRIMAGLLLQDRGGIEIFGMTPSEMQEKHPECIGYMPQRFGLYEDLSVRANLELHAKLRGLDEAERETIFGRLLAFTDLARFQSRLAGRLSGGMKQKLGIACALLGSPRLLLLDEPGVGVDPLSRRELWEMVGELSRDGMTVIWSTAYLDEAQKCPDILMLDGGRVIWKGAPEAFMDGVRGSVFLVPSGPARPAAILGQWTTRQGVEDVRVQGSSLRVVAAKEAPQALLDELARTGTACEPTVEDAYMSAVGGIVTTPSPYAPDSPDGVGAAGAGPSGAGAVPSGGAGGAGATASAYAIETEHLTRLFGTFRAADDITFKVRHGEIFGLLGPNGAGKSTTFRMLCGLLRPTSGACRVAGMDLLKSAGPARARLGYMAQKFALYTDIPVRENIRLCASLYGLSHRETKERVPLLAEALGVAPYLNSRTADLSLGLKQRLALLCATMHRPAVLFLDEPTSGVDARTRRDFWKHICAMTQGGTSVLVTTHFMDEAEYCDRLALIYRGRMIHNGTPDELRASVAGDGNAAPSLEDAFIAAVERWSAENEGAAS